MKTEFLQGLGLSDEQIKSVMAENGKDITTLKTKVATLEDDIKVKDGVIESRNTEIATFKKIDVETLKKEQFDLGKAEGSKEIEVFKKQNALEKALSNYKAKDSGILSKMLDMDKVEFNDKFEIVKGLEEQITPLKTSHEYLFENDKPNPQFTNPNPSNNQIITPTGSVSLSEALKEKFN